MVQGTLWFLSCTILPLHLAGRWFTATTCTLYGAAPHIYACFLSSIPKRAANHRPQNWCQILSRRNITLHHIHDIFTSPINGLNLVCEVSIIPCNNNNNNNIFEQSISVVSGSAPPVRIYAFKTETKTNSLFKKRQTVNHGNWWWTQSKE